MASRHVARNSSPAYTRNRAGAQLRPRPSTLSSSELEEHGNAQILVLPQQSLPQSGGGKEGM
jgi:hypothetical protein